MAVTTSQWERCWEVDKENLPTRIHYSSIIVLFNPSIFFCLIFFMSPSLFLSLKFVFLFQSVSSTSSAFLHWPLSPTASFCFPCLQLALQLTPSTPQHFNSYWHTTTLLTHSSPMQPTSSLDTLKTLLTNYLSTLHYNQEDCYLHKQCSKNFKSHYNH